MTFPHEFHGPKNVWSNRNVLVGTAKYTKSKIYLKRQPWRLMPTLSHHQFRIYSQRDETKLRRSPAKARRRRHIIHKTKQHEDSIVRFRRLWDLFCVVLVTHTHEPLKISSCSCVSVFHISLWQFSFCALNKRSLWGLYLRSAQLSKWPCFVA